MKYKEIESSLGELLESNCIKYIGKYNQITHFLITDLEGFLKFFREKGYSLSEYWRRTVGYFGFSDLCRVHINKDCAKSHIQRTWSHDKEFRTYYQDTEFRKISKLVLESDRTSRKFQKTNSRRLEMFYKNFPQDPLECCCYKEQILFLEKALGEFLDSEIDALLEDYEELMKETACTRQAVWSKRKKWIENLRRKASHYYLT